MDHGILDIKKYLAPGFTGGFFISNAPRLPFWGAILMPSAYVVGWPASISQRMPTNIPVDLYARKLAQRGWNPADIFEGHIGDHLSVTNPEFVRRRIAPLLMPESSQLPQPCL